MFTRLTAADGHDFDCWIQPAQGPRKGGIVILQEIFGVTDQLKGVADRYAALGHDVAIPALFDRQNPGTVLEFSNPGPGRDMMLAADLDKTMLDVGAAVQALRDRGCAKVGVIGFCWGGGLAIRAAQVLPIEGAVSFYGTRLPAYQIDPLRAPVLGHFGADDGHVPPEMLAGARAFWPEMEVHVYDGAGHAFANDRRPADFRADTAETAHARTAAFFDRVLA